MTFPTELLKNAVDGKTADFLTEHCPNLSYTVDAEALPDFLTGCRILAACTVDEPMDGVCLYLERPAGDVVALQIECKEDETQELLAICGDVYTKGDKKT